MPFQRTDAPQYWYIQKRLVGGVRTPRLATRVRDERIARAMEHLLETLAERCLTNPSWRPLLDAVCERRVTLPALYRANQAGRLAELLGTLSDQTVHAAIHAYRAAHTVKGPDRIGLDHLERLTRPDERLSALTGQRITALCLHREREGRGVKRNTVRRQLYRATSKLLRHHLGNGERNRIFAEVQFPAADDRRDRDLLPEEVARLLDAAYAVGGVELVAVVRLAMQTSADRGMLLHGWTGKRVAPGLRRRQVRIYREPDGTLSGEVYYPDKKAKDRERTVGLTPSLSELLLPLTQAKAPDEPVFSIGYPGLDYLWKQVRRKADLPGLRFKDLRKVFAQYAMQAAVPIAATSRGMGHSDTQRTADYAMARRATFTAEHARALEREMGLAS